MGGLAFRHTAVAFSVSVAGEGPHKQTTPNFKIFTETGDAIDDLYQFARRLLDRGRQNSARHRLAIKLVLSSFLAA